MNSINLQNFKPIELELILILHFKNFSIVFDGAAMTSYLTYFKRERELKSRKGSILLRRKYDQIRDFELQYLMSQLAHEGQ